MASYNVLRSKHATLVAATVDTVTFNQEWRAVEVKNRATSGDIYFRTDGTNPVVGADDTLFLGPGESLVVDFPSGSPDAVKLISAGTPPYSVTGVTP